MPTDLKTLGLNNRTFRILSSAGITTVERLCDYTVSEIVRLQGVGERSAENVFTCLRNINLKLKTEDVGFACYGWMKRLIVATQNAS